MLKQLLQLQKLDLQIEACKRRETEIPKQKRKYEEQRKRLTDELEAQQAHYRKVELDQRECESDIEQRQTQLNKYQAQLNTVKKNEEYQALLHEIDNIKRQVAHKEERVLELMMELESSKERLREDRERIDSELRKLDEHCAEVDAELEEARTERQRLEQEAAKAAEAVDGDLLHRYRRIRANKKSGAAVVPLREEVCSGCHMYVLPQLINEVMAGEIRACNHCGRLLYYRDNYDNETAGATDAAP